MAAGVGKSAKKARCRRVSRLRIRATHLQRRFQSASCSRRPLAGACGWEQAATATSRLPRLLTSRSAALIASSLLMLQILEASRARRELHRERARSTRSLVYIQSAGERDPLIVFSFDSMRSSNRQHAGWLVFIRCSASPRWAIRLFNAMSQNLRNATHGLHEIRLRTTPCRGSIVCPAGGPDYSQSEHVGNDLVADRHAWCMTRAALTSTSLCYPTM